MRVTNTCCSVEEGRKSLPQSSPFLAARWKWKVFPSSFEPIFTWYANLDDDSHFFRLRHSLRRQFTPTWVPLHMMLLEITWRWRAGGWASGFVDSFLKVASELWSWNLSRCLPFYGQEGKFPVWLMSDLTCDDCPSTNLFISFPSRGIPGAKGRGNEL